MKSKYTVLVAALSVLLAVTLAMPVYAQAYTYEDILRIHWSYPDVWYDPYYLGIVGTTWWILAFITVAYFYLKWRNNDKIFARQYIEYMRQLRQLRK